MAKQAKSPTITQAVAQRLRRDIITGAMPPGAIIRDLELSARYKASTSPVREALHLLASEGLVEMPPNRPKQVARLDRKLANDLVALHALLAMASYERGIPRIDDAGIRSMRRAMQAIKNATEREDPVAMLAAVRKFNDVVLVATDNAPLRLATVNSFSAIERIVVLWSIKGFMHPEDLQEILNLIETDKRENAIARFRRLLEQFKADVAALSPYL